MAVDLQELVAVTRLVEGFFKAHREAQPDPLALQEAIDLVARLRGAQVEIDRYADQLERLARAHFQLLKRSEPYDADRAISDIYAITARIRMVLTQMEGEAETLDLPAQST